MSERRGDWMQTYTGRQVWPLDMRPWDVDIEDIGHALAHQCRYAGHTTRFYSVAEHCVHVAAAVRDREPRHALWALLHDASEAYLVDVPRPVKRWLDGYAAIEAEVMAAVCRRFDLDPAMPAIVKVVDTAILTDERQQAMAPPPADWATDGVPLGVRLRFWSPARAADQFHRAFGVLA